MRLVSMLRLVVRGLVVRGKEGSGSGLDGLGGVRRRFHSGEILYVTIHGCSCLFLVVSNVLETPVPLKCFGERIDTIYNSETEKKIKLIY